MAKRKDGRTERPIIMRGDEVRAVIEGRKVVTRRLVKPQPKCGGSACAWSASGCGAPAGQWYCGTCAAGVRLTRDDVAGLRCPFGDPGDLLWVRETYRPRQADNVSVAGPLADIQYRADGARRDDVEMPLATFERWTEQNYHLWEHGDKLQAWWDRWRSPAQMPRWAARLVLEVERSGIERSVDDYGREGWCWVVGHRVEEIDHA